MECVRPGLDAIRRMLLAEPDLAILGVNSPDRDWEFCRRVLVFHDRPLLMLLSSGDELDRVQGLELGADDCMLKPFLMIELVASVRALLCRDIVHGPRLSQSLFVDGDLTIDRMRREVPLDGLSVRLTVTEFRMLACSVQYAGEVLSPKRLIAQVCGGGSVPRCAATSSCMSATLGRSSSRAPARPRRIVTRRGEGCIFNWLAVDNRE